ncbi:MAG: TlpA disulfide reductase family protein [Candidatus Poribacteria bacterium]|nr:TlpA disulfide reductase family protein [Candidatus Poribacteria bacterium]
MFRTITVFFSFCTLVSLAIALVTSCGDVSDDPADQTSEQEVVSTEWAKSAPDFKLLSTQLEQVTLSSFKGKVVLLDFWATWCQPCQVEMPIFEQLHHQYENKGFSVVGISVDREKLTVVEPFVENLGIGYPILFADEKVFREYAIMALPTAVLIDRQGKIRHRFEGATGSKESYVELIEKWL